MGESKPKPANVLFVAYGHWPDGSFESQAFFSRHDAEQRIAKLSFEHDWQVAEYALVLR